MKGNPPDHVLLASYLLGELPEEARLQIEQRCLEDDDFFEQLEAVEAELIDDSVRGELRGRRRKQFEERLGSEKAAQFELAKLLTGYSQPQPTFLAGLWRTGAFPRIAAAVASLALAIFAAWFTLTRWSATPPVPPQMATATPPPVQRPDLSIAPPARAAQPSVAQPAVAQLAVKGKQTVAPLIAVAPPTVEARQPQVATGAALSAPPPPIPSQPVAEGTLKGRVLDPSGAVVPNAEISATNTATGGVIKAQSDTLGQYDLDRLPAGSYNVAASAPGFATTRSDASIAGNQTAIKDLTITVGQSAATVEVTQSQTAVQVAPQTLASTLSKGPALNMLAMPSTSFSLSQIYPARGASNVFVNSVVVFRLVDSPSTAKSLPAVTLTGPNGAVAGVITASTHRRFVTFAPSQGLLANTSYTVSSTVTMLQGSFTTGSSSDNQAPSVELKDPTHSPITLQFSKTMDPATLTPDNFQVTDAASKALISGAVHVSEDLRTASFIPSVPLPPDHSFEIVIKTGVKDTSGNGLANQMRFHFTTNR